MAFDEMNVYEPFRKNTLDRLLSKEIESLDDFFVAIDKGLLYGAFWKKFYESGISPTQFRQYLDRSATLDEKAILSAVLELLRADAAVRNAGIKYPVHFSKLALLRSWFPEGKIIMLFRNPKAMIASKLNDSATAERKSRSLFHRVFIHYSTLLFFSLEFRRSVRVFLKHRTFIHKVHYESLVLSQKSTAMRICEFCGIRYEPKMLSVTGKDSSFGYSERGAICPATVDAYQHILSPFDQWLIDILTHRSYTKIQ